VIERLEDRRLLAAVFYDQDSSSVKVHAGEGDDAITIVRRDSRIIVTLNKIKRTFDRANVAWIEVLCGGGNDHVNGVFTSVPIHASGQAGRDTLVGGWGDDFFFGGDNPDRLIGNEGNDRMDGEGGRDSIVGGNGADTLSGDGGDDRVWGDDGDDDISDLAGQDFIDGAAGADWVVGYDPNDHFHVSIESETILYNGNHADPNVYLHAIRRRDGQFAVAVAASHGASGYGRAFGDMTRKNRVFDASVSGIDLAGPDGGRLTVVETEMHTYILGRLADGSYIFKAGHDERLLGTITVGIRDGRLVDTPTVSRAPSPGIVPME
jgi:Ca2+-binding RTX toxin-like protein